MMCATCFFAFYTNLTQSLGLTLTSNSILRSSVSEHVLTELTQDGKSDAGLGWRRIRSLNHMLCHSSALTSSLQAVSPRLRNPGSCLIY
ncbi:hypothetical protein B0T20DRAFT_64892 [Sordaria brevicollis]|uniref:Secreted protein n=1 Tax=Sordaria brevicollis TaxID=83679 RepID=A0AAE0U5W5_SORBR|nr:hypothetical protein B0T20DRAFT_64892 [Sordaria brevicollis]